MISRVLDVLVPATLIIDGVVIADGRASVWIAVSVVCGGIWALARARRSCR